MDLDLEAKDSMTVLYSKKLYAAGQWRDRRRVARDKQKACEGDWTSS